MHNITFNDVELNPVRNDYEGEMIINEDQIYDFIANDEMVYHIIATSDVRADIYVPDVNRS